MPAPSEIVSFAVFECKGANPDSRLNETNVVSVDISRDGARRVGCAYLKTLQGTSAISPPKFYCIASSEPTSFDAQLKSTKDDTQKSNPNMSRFDLEDLILQKIERSYPVCPHKKPI